MRLLAALLLAVTALTATPPAPATAATAPGCDPIDPAACLLPFPNNWFTVPDRSTDTGRRLALTAETTPKNAAGTPVAPAEWNRSDGFSPGSMILARVPGLDLARTGAAPITDIGSSLDRDAPIVVLDTQTGERWPYWAELDANAPQDRQALIVRPARNLREGHTYAVVLRGLRDAAGAPIRPARRSRACSGARCRPPIPCTAGSGCSIGCGGSVSPARASTWPGTSPWRANAGSANGRWPCATTRCASCAGARRSSP